jgi:hypothetical protein
MRSYHMNRIAAAFSSLLVCILSSSPLVCSSLLHPSRDMSSRALLSYRTAVAIFSRASPRGKGLVSVLPFVSLVATLFFPIPSDNPPVPQPRTTSSPSPNPLCLLYPPEYNSTSFLYQGHRQARKGGYRTNGIVLEHAKRLMCARSLHGAVVARHGHGDEAHHDRAGLCCVVVLLACACRSLDWHCGSWRGDTQPYGRIRGCRGKWPYRGAHSYLSSPLRNVVGGVNGGDVKRCGSWRVERRFAAG